MKVVNFFGQFPLPKSYIGIQLWHYLFFGQLTECLFHCWHWMVFSRTTLFSCMKSPRILTLPLLFGTMAIGESQVVVSSIGLIMPISSILWISSFTLGSWGIGLQLRVVRLNGLDIRICFDLVFAFETSKTFE